MHTEIIESASQVNWKLDGKFVLAQSLREQAIAVIDQTPFPTTKTEAWKYTRLTKIKNGQFSIQNESSEIQVPIVDSESLKIVFVNGHYSAQHSDSSFPEGLKVIPLSEMDEKERNYIGLNLNPENELFHAFNTAYATDGIYIHVSAKMVIEKTIELIYITSGKNVLSTIRNTITTEAFSALKVIQHFVSDLATTDSFTNVISEISVGSNSNLTIDKLQEESDSHIQIASEIIQQQKDSTFTINTITLNGLLVRNNLTINVQGNNCETNLNGAYILNGNQHVDNHTVVDHQVAHCISNELYKGVIDGNATAVFNGKVFVRKDAQKINAFQSNANVLLSNDATVNSKPELEIYADDVKCSHGSTTGQLDENAIFYLRARGIGEKAARQLMIGAFVEDVFEKIKNETVVNHIENVLVNRFGWTQK